MEKTVSSLAPFILFPFNTQQSLQPQPLTRLSTSIQDKPSGYTNLTKLDIWRNIPGCQNARFYMDEILE